MGTLRCVIARIGQRAWLVLRQHANQAARSISGGGIKTDTNGTMSTNSIFLLPTIHSRKNLAPTCTDVAALQDLTEHVLTTEAGNLFQFNRSSRQADRKDRSMAWEQANGAVQMVEYLMRGHSAQIPGTLWHGWTDGALVSDDPLTNLETMLELLDRMWEEGQLYMRVRKNHLSQLVSEEELKSHLDVIGRDWAPFAREDTAENDTVKEGDPITSGRVKIKENRDAGKISRDDTANDFAPPGPTVTMYDIMLDTMAVTATAVGNPQHFASRPASDILTAKFAIGIHGIILDRHILDGDDELNDNFHTVPTQISSNALIRTCANLYYDGESQVLRDYALIAALIGNQTLERSALEKNSSTYEYTMDVLAKYIPASTSRGNMLCALWTLAKEEGVFNEDIREAYLKASKPSNGHDHDKWIQAYLIGKNVSTGTPQRWRRRVNKYRMIRKQIAY